LIAENLFAFRRTSADNIWALPAFKSVAPSTGKYRFGAFEVRTPARELYKHGLKLKLRPQPFQILQILLERPGQVVTREELRRMLWSSETFVDFEHGLNTSVKDLRGVLGDSASAPRYIETLPKLGYRLIVPVATESAAEPATTIEAPAQEFSVQSTEVPLSSTTTPIFVGTLTQWGGWTEPPF
jgi:DNA-binding winged helix-turn-helix (wHTH) protein